MSQKAVLQPGDLKNPTGLGKQPLTAIIADLSYLVVSERAKKAIRYVVDGTDDDVVIQLGGDVTASRELGLTSGANVNNYKLQRIQQRNRVDICKGKPAPGVMIRLGQLYEAMVRASGKPVNPPKGCPGWLVMIMMELLGASYGAHPDQKLDYTVRDLEALFREGDIPSEMLVRMLLDREVLQQVFSQYAWFFYTPDRLGKLEKASEFLAEQLPTVREILKQGNAEQRVNALNNLAAFGFDPALLADDLTALAVGSSKTTRESTLHLVREKPEALREPLVRKLHEGDTSERHEAAQVLWRLYGTEAVNTLKAHVETESSERIRQTIGKLTAGANLSSEATAAIELPPLDVEVGEIALGESAKAGWDDYLERVYQFEMQQYQRQLDMYNGPDRPTWMRKPEEPKRPEASRLKAMLAFIETGKGWQQSTHQHRPYAAVEVGSWLAPPEVKLVHIPRMAMVLHMLNVNAQQDWMFWQTRDHLDVYRSRCQPPFGLRELEAVFATLPNVKPGMLLRYWLNIDRQYNAFCDWEPEAIWPAYAEHPDFLKDALGIGPGARRTPYDYAAPTRRRNAYRVLAMFPRLPDEFIPLLWDTALGESKSDRLPAQEALATIPDKTSKILIALDDGRQAIRGAAAEWLGRLGDAAAIEPLKEAVRKEKQELVKGQIMQALEKLGADVSEFLDRKKLLKDAEAGLAKKKPKGLEWFSFDTLPALHWSDTKKAVDPKVVQWWVIQSVQQKSAACGPLVKRYLAMCEPQEVTTLARHLLSSWIAEDTRTASHEEAAERAKKESDQFFAQHGKQQWYLDHYKSKENHYNQLFQGYSAACITSAIGEKGMLALVAAGADRECIRMCEQYVRKHFGTRLAQSKALLEVLAWIPNPLAIQVLLSIANRFRTKALRKLAEEFVQALADREGWTIDELADRTIPDAGFARPVDENGEPTGTTATLVLDYGPRQFTVTLDDDLQPVITTAEGKSVKNVPAPGKSDDEEKAKAAKKSFGEAKKIVKDVVKLQSERLYEAMCTQRSWSFDDWNRYLADHPIVGRLCTRLAWVAFELNGENETFVGLFRPLEDGSLTNAADEEVTLGPDVRVKLAHTANVPPELEPAWQQHFKDYDVEPLFPQFGRPVYIASEKSKKDNGIHDFEGHCLTTFQLRGKATKLGYIRGDAEDGGSFAVYRKPFPSLRVQSVIEFTGSYVPEQDIPAAITELYFTAMKTGHEGVSSWNETRVPLDKIPAVLLTECYNDVKTIAAEGSGYDAEWRKKGLFG